MKNLKIDSGKLLAWVSGIGIAGFAFPNPFVLECALCICVISIMYVFLIPSLRHKFSLGSRWVYIPLLIIVVATIASNIYRYFSDRDFQSLIGSCFMSLFLFTFYIIARILGKEIFKPLAWVVIIESISVVVYSLLIRYGIQNGGIASTLNYNIATGLLVMGSILAIVNKQWILICISAIGLFFTGAEEGLIAFGIIFIAILIRRDFSKRLWLIVGLVLIIGILGVFPFSYTKSLYANVIDNANMLIFNEHSQVVSSYYANEPEAFNSTADYYLRYRVTLDQKGLTLNPLGNGYVLNPGFEVPHNSFLLANYQIGIIGALAWLFLTFYGLIKTKWKYAFIAVFALSLFDNFLFAQLGIFWFTLIGVSSLPELKSDLIFKRG